MSGHGASAAAGYWHRASPYIILTADDGYDGNDNGGGANSRLGRGDGKEGRRPGSSMLPTSSLQSRPAPRVRHTTFYNTLYYYYYTSLGQQPVYASAEDAARPFSPANVARRRPVTCPYEFTIRQSSPGYARTRDAVVIKM